MENQNIKIKMMGYYVECEILSSEPELEFTATFSTSKKKPLKFKNDEENFVVKGPSNLCIFDMETEETEKKFKTTFVMRYDCSNYSTMDLNISQKGTIYDAKASAKSSDNVISFYSVDNVAYVEFKNHEHLTSYYKKDFKIINPKKSKK